MLGKSPHLRLEMIVKREKSKIKAKCMIRSPKSFSVSNVRVGGSVRDGKV